MKFFSKAKDGGPESTVTGYWLVEIKSLFSIALLKFEDGSRDAYHSHAFDSLNWVLRGSVCEKQIQTLNDGRTIVPIRETVYRPGLRPLVTWRETFHKVASKGTTWVLSFRGPWAKTWEEWNPKTTEFTTLTHGRKVV